MHAEALNDLPLLVGAPVAHLRGLENAHAGGRPPQGFGLKAGESRGLGEAEAELGGDGGQGVRELIADMRAAVASLKKAGGRVAAVRNAVEAGVSEFERAFEWILKTADDPRLAAAADGNYLQLCGVVCGGWMMAESARTSQDRLDAGTRDTAFYESKLATASFYAAQIMPSAAALAHAIVDGSAAVVALDTASF